MKQLLLLLSTICCGSMTAQTLQINELMQSNIDCIMDDIHEFPDSWVELYNPTEEAINLKDYKIGTKNKVNKAWQLPDKTVGSGKYVIIYCDKAGEDAGVSAIHTDFRLESNKEGNIYLFKDGEVVDMVENFGAQPAPNIAYGRSTDGGDEWGYELEPTPGAANKGGVVDADHLLGEPVFNMPGKVYETSKNIRLNITLPDGAPEGSVIRFTEDGTEPTATSTLYESPIYINKTKVIRAKLFCDGYLSPRATVQSYIFLDRSMTIPVVSITTKDAYLNDKNEGIFAVNSKANQINWRRPITIEVFDEPNKESVINQICETRVMGGQSRDWARKSMAIYANKRFGEKRLDYEFFPDQKPGLTNFKSIMLRNAGNDFDGMFMRDAIIQRSMAQHVDLDWQAWRPAVVFINGKYHSMLNFRERSNDDNVFSNYNELEDIDMIEISQENSQMVTELKAGTQDNYDAFVAFYHETGHTLAEYAELMEWEEYINLMAMNIYFNNQDFPGNNLVLWRPIADGGRWRFIAKDTDFGLGLYGSQPDYNTIKWLYTPNYDSGRAWANTSEATMLFRHLMDDPDFKREFIDRMAIYMGDFLNEKGVRAIWDPMYELTLPELIIHRDNLGSGGWWWGGGSEGSINNEVNNARNWLSKRTENVYKQLADYYKTGTARTLTINKTSKSDMEIIINGVTLNNNVFDGKFFEGRSFTVSGKVADDMEIKGWSVTGAVTKEVEGSELTMQMANGTVNINPIIAPVIGGGSGIVEMNVNESATQHPIYDLTGRKVNTPKKGGIYIQNGKKQVWR